MKKAIRVILSLVALTILVVLLFQNLGRREIKKDIIAPPVLIDYATKGDLKKIFSTNSYIEADKVVTVLPRAMGLVDNFLVDVGDKVVKDQILARLDSQLLELNMRQARGTWDYAKQNLERIWSLYNENVTSLQNYEAAKSNHESALSQYEMARLRLDYATVRSPLEGVVLEKHLNEGTLANQQTPLLTIASLDRLKIRANVPERYYDHFVTRDNSLVLTLTRRDSKKIHYARIDRISPVISPLSKTFEVIGLIDDPDNLLRPGMFIRISFLLEEAIGVHYLPLDTLTEMKTLWYYDTEAGTAKTLTVDSPFKNDKFFVIPENLSDHLFIIEGQFFLKEGEDVAVLNKEILP